ncbi:MAG: LacI family DNA-binding transcriptional regulator [Clostridia bacterium]|nr:LacI family DNA-binding transcriptional regulator [Clostridia bacterium]
MANLDDVAREAGVSASTVSRVLNGSASISEKTRERVLLAVGRLQYRKRAYTTGSAKLNNVAGIVMPDMTSDYYTRLMHTINEQFCQKDYSVLFAVTNFDPDETVRAVERMSRIHVRCLLIILDDTETVSHRLMETVRLSGLPTMFITSKYIPDLDVDCLFVDEERGNTMAVEHLLHRGYRRIGFIGEYNTRNRGDFFRRIMKQYHMPVYPSLVRIGRERGEEGGYLRMREMLSMRELPDAIYAGYDQMAIGAIHAIGESGLHIPGDIAVIGFDDIATSRYVAGGITTIGTPFDDMAAICVRILMHRIAQPFGQPQQVAIKPSLIVRGTT